MQSTVRQAQSLCEDRANRAGSVHSDSLDSVAATIMAEPDSGVKSTWARFSRYGLGANALCGQQHHGASALRPHQGIQHALHF